MCVFIVMKHKNATRNSKNLELTRVPRIKLASLLFKQPVRKRNILVKGPQLEVHRGRRVEGSVTEETEGSKGTPTQILLHPSRMAHKVARDQTWTRRKFLFWNTLYERSVNSGSRVGLNSDSPFDYDRLSPYIKSRSHVIGYRFTNVKSNSHK